MSATANVHWAFAGLEVLVCAGFVVAVAAAAVDIDDDLGSL